MENVNLEAIYEQCIKLSHQIKNPILKECCERILHDYQDAIMRKPASLGNYHYFRGGLLCHMYCVTKNALSIMDLYTKLKVDSDLIIFGALLHDIGKATEYTDFMHNQAGYISNDFELLGQSYKSMHIIESYLSKFSLDVEFKSQILHIIRATHEEENVSKMLEAIIVQYADKLDKKMSSISLMFNKAKKGAQFALNENEQVYKSLNEQYANTWYFE
ncbi:MAG: HD domain-containing protein [Bacilli bacterium]|nr:HD domain-containing protein [Bacilli bacterium]